MNISRLWLQKWVNFTTELDDTALAKSLTMAGLEIESIKKTSVDTIFELSITPNRGDCLSVLGIAREVHALNQGQLNTKLLHPDVNLDPMVKPWNHNFDVFQKPSTHSIEMPTPSVVVAAPELCPRYIGALYQRTTSLWQTPIEIVNRLANCDIRSIHPVVDLTQYVMLELGQPLHAFDADKIAFPLTVRLAYPGETLTLLDGNTVDLTTDTLIIADKIGPQAIAGVMGGLFSAVTEHTTNIFFESAFFTPTAIAGIARKYRVKSEAAYRFERGVDPQLPEYALARILTLLTQIEPTSGLIAPIITVEQPITPPRLSLTLQRSRVAKILGFEIPDDVVATILDRLAMAPVTTPTGWQVSIPSYRFDITREIDIIEELIRIYGYDHLPTHQAHYLPQANTHSEEILPQSRLQQALINRGYSEVVSYSFVSHELQAKLCANAPALLIANPISTDLSAMRLSLWPSLLPIACYNINRQQSRVRIFEFGHCYPADAPEYAVLAGLATGLTIPLQWGVEKKLIDFYDIKQDIQALLQLTLMKDIFVFEAGSHPALHPGQTAKILVNNQHIGWLGALHPKFLDLLGLSQTIYLFEIKLNALSKTRLPQDVLLSKFPIVRRDLAFLMPEHVKHDTIEKLFYRHGGELLVALTLFDVYQGKGMPAGFKSMAFSISLQHQTRTLLDDEVTQLITKLTQAVCDTFGAKLRD